MKNIKKSFAFLTLMIAVVSVDLFAQDHTFTEEAMLATGIPVISISTVNGAAITSKEQYVQIESFKLTAQNRYYNISRSRSDVARPDQGRYADEIRGRGNATWQKPEWDLDYPKKPYRIRFTERISVLGLPEARNWVLLAEYRDPSRMFNAIALEVARNVFEMPFTNNYIHVHLFLNGDYRGVYGFTEHKQVHENRINIDSRNGWYVNIDDYFDEDPKFRTNWPYNLPVMIKSPEPEGVTSGEHEAFRFVRDDWNHLANLMHSGGSEFPDNGYRDLIDIRSVAEFLLVNEITMNQELGQEAGWGGQRSVRSMLAYKDVGEKIMLGPVWDFDCGFGYNYQSTHRYFEGHTSFIKKIDFLQRFYKDTVFTATLKKRWNDNYERIGNMTGFIDNLRSKIAAAVAEDTRRWYRDNNTNQNQGYVSNEYNTDHASVVNNLKNWWNQRITWLNDEINRLPGTYVGVAPSRSPAASAASASSVTVTGRTLHVSPSGNASARIRVIDVKGRTRADFSVTGSGSFSLARLPVGRYFVEVRGAGTRHTVPVMVR